MATIRRRNGKYQVQVRINGYTRSKTFPSHDLAKKWANKQELIAFTEPDDRPRYVPVNFSEILAKYWDYARHHHKGALVEKIVIKALMREHWINKPISELCRADIMEFRDRRLLSVKPDTFKRQLNIIRSASRMAAEEWGWICTRVLFDRIKLPKQDEKQIRRIDPKTEAILLRGAANLQNPFVHPLIVLAIETGLRRSEMLRLTLDDWEKENALLHASATKNGRCRSIPLSDRAARTLHKLDKTHADKLFPITPNSVNLNFQRLKRTTGLLWIRFHDLRHEAISRFFEYGLSIAEVRSISGHKDLSQLQNYVLIDEERVKRLISGQ